MEIKIKMDFLFTIYIVKLVDKTAITLTPPTVGRQSADLSADKMLDFSSLFSSADKK